MNASKYMPIKSYKELLVWQKGIQLVKETYKITEQLPKRELYILVAQILRAAISIPSNIAEGYRRNHRPEFIHFLSIALGSAAELETQIIIVKSQYNTINVANAEVIVDEIQRMLYTMIVKLKLNPAPPARSTLGAQR
jgi:four helix bundle protein